MGSLPNAIIRLRAMLWPLLRRHQQNPSDDLRQTEPALLNLLRVLFEYKHHGANPALAAALVGSELEAPLKTIEDSLDGLDELLRDSEEVRDMAVIVYGEEERKRISIITLNFSKHAKFFLSHLSKITGLKYEFPSFTVSDMKTFWDLEAKLFELRKHVVPHFPGWRLHDNTDRHWKILVKVFRYGVPRWEEDKIAIHWEFIRYYVDRLLDDAEYQDSKAVESPGFSSTSSSPRTYGPGPLPIPTDAYLSTNRDRSTRQSWSHREKKVKFESTVPSSSKPRSSSHSYPRRPASPTGSEFSTTYAEADLLRPTDDTRGRSRHVPSPTNDPGIDIAAYINEKVAQSQAAATHDSRSYGSGTASSDLSNRSPATSVAEEPLQLRKEIRMKRSQSRGRYMTRAERKLEMEKVEQGRQERERMRKHKEESGEIRVHRRDASGGSGASFGSTGSGGQRGDDRGRRR